jgi:hypothetical protein
MTASKRKRCVNVAWRRDRHVRILSDAFGYRGKIGSIINVGERFVYVRIRLGRKPGQHDEVAYPPGDLKLI